MTSETEVHTKGRCLHCSIMERVLQAMLENEEIDEDFVAKVLTFCLAEIIVIVCTSEEEIQTAKQCFSEVLSICIDAQKHLQAARASRAGQVN